MLLVMLMYVFAIMGYYLFGQRDSGAADEYYWGNLGAAFLTLFVYVTADGWTAVIDSAGVNGVDYTSKFTSSPISVLRLFWHFVCVRINWLYRSELGHSQRSFES